MYLLILLSTLNFLGLLYLTFIIYRKIVSQDKKPVSSNASISDDQINLINNSIQKVAIIRFNPFDDLGGDQSFSLAMLNSDNDGIVLTSLHNRDNTRVYAKPVKSAKGDNITLSQEEKNAILKAIKH